MKAVADKVHKYACGHADILDVKLILKRNNLLSPGVENYLTYLMIVATSQPQPSIRASLFSLNHNFNEVGCVYHVLLKTF